MKRFIATFLFISLIFFGCDSAGTQSPTRQVHVSGHGNMELVVQSDGETVASIDEEMDNLNKLDVSGLETATVRIDTSTFENLGAVQTWTGETIHMNRPYTHPDWDLQGSDYVIEVAW